MIAANLFGLDWKEDEHDGSPAIEFSFQGSDEMEQTSGRGWAMFDGGELSGMIMFFQGGESKFTAKKT